MDDEARRITSELARLARALPRPIIVSLAEALAGCASSDWAAIRLRVAQVVPHPHYRDLVARFLKQCAACRAVASPQSISLSLLAAAEMAHQQRDSQNLELVWTGPPTQVVPLRRTEQAILQVIDSAVRSVIVASFAVYNIPRIADALLRAANRAVRMNLVLESPDHEAGRTAHATLKALGSSVANASRIFVWPPTQRAKDARGRQGVLHVKCVAADGEWLFLSSANLTRSALDLNMELGVLIKGGKAPRQIEALFDELIQANILVEC
jgi:phosphatidylserine/phosphatidylglycerophosphate/cardiolipin synthase-like enzyme